MSRRSPSSLRVRALALGVGLTAVLAGPAAGAEKAIWGPITLPNGVSAMALYVELGVDTLELSLNWSDVAKRRPAAATDPADPAYVWPPEIAAADAEAERRGIHLALLVANTPPWANGGREPIWAPQRPQDYADFMTAASRRYPRVRRWMIWGEPNRSDRFQPNAENSEIGPRAYATLLQSAYVALKRQSRDNRVIGGMTWTSGTVRPTGFLRRMRLADGRPPQLDWWGHNPFPFRFPNISQPPLAGFRDISDSDTFSDEIARVYGRRVPLWMSEFTVQSDRASAQFATFVSRAAQARYITAGWKLADDLGGAVAGIGWLALLDEIPATASANYGLMTAALERKPSFAAFQHAPSERLRPVVAVAAGATRALLRTRGLVIRVTPRTSGSIVVELRRAGHLHARSRRQAQAGATTTLRLRSRAAAGQYVVSVRAARAATTRRTLRVR